MKKCDILGEGSKHTLTPSYVFSGVKTSPQYLRLRDHRPRVGPRTWVHQPARPKFESSLLVMMQKDRFTATVALP